MKITDFVKKGTLKGRSRVERFQELSKGKTKEEVRKLEVTLLKPEPIPVNTYEAATPAAKHVLTTRTAKIIMPDDHYFDLLKKYFPVSRHIESSISNPTLLCKFLDALEDGSIIYDKKNKELKFR